MAVRLLPLRVQKNPSGGGWLDERGRKRRNCRPNPSKWRTIIQEGDPLAMIDSYLDSGTSYPGDAAIDDLQVTAEMYVEHYWREVEDFEPPGDLVGWTLKWVEGWGGRSRTFEYQIPEVIEATNRLTAEDAIVYYQERVRYHCDQAKKLGSWREQPAMFRTWFQELTYLAGILALGHDLLSENNIFIDTTFWHRWEGMGGKPPPWDWIAGSMLDVGGEVAFERFKKACPERYAWPETTSLGNWLWYFDRHEGDALLVAANRIALCNLLVDIPYFDCSWATRERTVVSTYHGGASTRYDLYLQLLRPSGIPTLLAYVWLWWQDIVTQKQTVPADPDLYEQMSPPPAEEEEAEVGLPGNLEEGSYSEGSLRVQDLLPVALDILEQVNPAAYTQLVGQPFGAIPAHAQEDEEAEWWEYEGPCLLDEVIDAANQYLAGYGYYLGSHPGDPADFGIWQEEPDEEDLPPAWQHEH